MYGDQALAALQQAGLEVTVKRITKDNPRYKDKEGMVVGQVPAAEGVAMIGSTVVVTIYKTGQGYQQGGYGGGYGQPDDYYDDGNGQQGDSLPPDSGGWQPPLPGEGPGEGMDEPGFDGGNLGDDVPNVPPPSGGKLRPALPKPSGKPGTIVAKPVHPARTPVRQSVPRPDSLSPGHTRDIGRQLDKARGLSTGKTAAQSEGIQPQPVRRSPVKVGQSNTQTPSPAAVSKTGQMKPVGSRGIVMDTAKPKAVTGVDQKKKGEEKSWLQRLFQ